MNLLKKYRRTIIVFLVWLFLLAVASTEQGMEFNAVYCLIGLIVLAALQFMFGFWPDRAALREEGNRREQERQERAELGEEAWQAYRAEKEQAKLGRKKMLTKAFLLDALMGTAYLGLTRFVYGGGREWIQQAIPELIWVMTSFLVLAIWIVSFPERKRGGKIFMIEILFILPFFLHPFAPLLLYLNMRFAGCYLFFSLGWCFLVLGIGYMRQVRKRRDSCTVLITGKVVGNVKSYLRTAEHNSESLSVPSYQPVLEYYADGTYQQVTCSDGQPKPMPVGMVCEIYYNPEKPEEFRFASDHKPLTEKIVGPICLGIGFLMLILMICVWLLPF